VLPWKHARRYPHGVAWVRQVDDDTWKVGWRTGGRGARQCSVRFSSPERAEIARRLVEDRGGDITSDEVYDAVLGPGEAGAAGLPPSRCPLLRDWVAQWLPSRTRPAPRQIGEYEAMWTSRILPTLGDKHMDHVTGIDVGRLIHDLRTTPTPRAHNGLSEARVSKYYTELSAAFAAAIKAQATTRVTRNPCRESDFTRNQVAHDDAGDDTDEPVYLTPAQFRHLRAQFAEHYHPLLDVLVGTGARWSEATALAVSAANPARQVRGKPVAASVRISRAWKQDKASRPYLGSTKGKSKRTVPAPTWLGPVLAAQAEEAPGQWAAWRERMRRQASGVGRSTGGRKAIERAREALRLVKEPLLLTAPQGGPYDYGSFLTQVWNPAVARAMRCAEHPPPDCGGPVPAGVDLGVLCKDHGGTRADGRPCSKELVPGMTRCTWHMGPAPDAVSTCDCPTRLPVRPTPHDLRHTFASWFLHGGGNMRRLQELLGHESITTTEIYSGLLPGSEDAVVAALDAAWNG
jgi:integrase